MGNWLKREENWLHRPPREKPAQADESILKPTQYGVVYYPIKCPKCGSKNNKCYASSPPIRYHKCKVCKYRFKSKEASESEILAKKVLTTL